MEAVELDHDNSEAESDENDADAYKAQARAPSVFHDDLMRKSGFYAQLKPVHEDDPDGEEEKKEDALV